jgi:hypothetical protein
MYCVCGEKQIAGIDYFESYAPVAAWFTIHMVMNLALQNGWATQHVDFSNTFVQITLDEMFLDDHNNGYKDRVILKFDKSLYGPVQAPQT